METENVLDCSITITVTNSAIEKVISGKNTIKSLFNTNQLNLAKIANSDISYSSLLVLGPINTKYYPSITLGTLDYENVCATMWELDGEVISLEV